MKFILLLSFILLYCCTCKQQPIQKANVDTSEMLSQLSKISKMEDSLLGDKLSDTFRKWFPIWDTVLANDRFYRGASIKYLDYSDEQNKLDSINEIIVTSFLDKYGYPGKYQASSMGKYAIFIVIQHAPVKTQEKYYPLFIEAYKKNTFNGWGIALLEDRINMYRHRKQYYGTQHNIDEDGDDYLYPVVNPDSINAWRKQMIANDTIDISIEKEFKESYKKEWDIEQYKKDLPGLIKKFKVTDSTPIRFVKQP